MAARMGTFFRARMALRNREIRTREGKNMLNREWTSNPVRLDCYLGVSSGPEMQHAAGAHAGLPKSAQKKSVEEKWSGWADLNCRPLAPQAALKIDSRVFS